MSFSRRFKMTGKRNLQIKTRLHLIIKQHCFVMQISFFCHFKLSRNRLFLVEISGNKGRNAFLTSIASQKIFRPYFQKSRPECYFLCLFYFLSPYSGHLRSDFVVLLLLLPARSWSQDQKCPEKQDKKSKREMIKKLQIIRMYNEPSLDFFL